ncbi:MULTISPECIES: hypothetical protein [unclassified Microcoleus]|uniref:hypothetical protein n=1 Tax=unclassified Microcoleus TaxID=2642155 RepID=UPI002FCF396F
MIIAPNNHEAGSYELTLTELIDHYKYGDITRKGLVRFYCKLHPYFNPWLNELETRKVCYKLSLAEPLFYSAVREIEEEDF